MIDGFYDDLPQDANELKRRRPDLRKAHFICCKCRKEPWAMASYGLHVGGKGGQTLSGNGAIHAQLKCHGDTEEILILFADANNYINSGEKIPVFDNVNRFEVNRIIIPGEQKLHLPGFDG